MTKTALHIIRKQVLDLELPTERDAFQLQKRMSRLYQSEVLPVLSDKLDALGLNEHVLRIQHLEIDLGKFQLERLDKDFAAICVAAIEKQLKEKLAHYLLQAPIEEEQAFFTSKDFSGNSDIATPIDHSLLQNYIENNITFNESSDAHEQILPVATASLTHFFYFLQTGTLPWNARHVSLASLETIVLELTAKQPTSILQLFIQVIKNQPTSLQRLVRQCSSEWLEQLVSQFLQMPVSIIKNLVKQQIKLQNKTVTPLFLQTIYQAIFTYLTTAENPTIDGVQRAVASVNIVESPAAAIQKETVKHKVILHPKENITSKTTTDPLPDNALFIDNAGIILLAPFLPILLETVTFTMGGQFLDRTTQERAIHLLQYIITGEENTAEHLLTLHKILCNLPVQEPIQRFVPLTESEKEEADHLLQVAIEHWGALGNTSPNGLREGFLQRTGKLTYQADKWLLQVEHKAIDILLDRLPWSYNIIKLPWMQTPIYTQWV